MDGTIGFVIGIAVGLGGAIFVFWRLFKSVSGKVQAFKLAKDESIAGHSFRYLEVLCRELGNHMVKRDPDYFLKTYNRWREEYDRIGELSASEMKDRLRVISSEIPTYEEFDLVGVRDFIDVDQELMARDIDEIAEHYRKIKSWIALLSRTDEEWRYASGWRFGDEKFRSGIDEHDVLTKEIRRQRHRKLKSEIDRAMEAYWDNRGDEINWDSAGYSVRMLPEVGPANVYGLELKRLNEFAVAEIFHYDDGGVYRSYFESDADFSENSRIIII